MIKPHRLSLIVIQTFLTLIGIALAWGLSQWPLGDEFAFVATDWDWLAESTYVAIQYFIFGLIVTLILSIPIWLALRIFDGDLKGAQLGAVLLWPLVPWLLFSILAGIRFYYYRPFI